VTGRKRERNIGLTGGASVMKNEGETTKSSLSKSNKGR